MFCCRNRLKELKETPQLSEKLDDESSSRVYYSSVAFQDQVYKAGDCFYLQPDSFSFSVTPAPPEKISVKKGREVGLITYTIVHIGY